MALMLEIAMVRGRDDDDDDDGADETYFDGFKTKFLYQYVLFQW